jgi:hypothetical protein
LDEGIIAATHPVRSYKTIQDPKRALSLESGHHFSICALNIKVEARNLHLGKGGKSASEKDQR